MRILIVSYFAEDHLHNSSAQNTRFLASGLLHEGHDVRVVCAAAREGTIIQNGYPLTKIPITSANWEKRWLGAWRPDDRVRKISSTYYEDWLPDVVIVGAWQHLGEFVSVASDLGIPIIQYVHDYSILCLRIWLVDTWGEICSGPTSLNKCKRCMIASMSWKAKIADSLLSLPVAKDFSTTNLTILGRRLSDLQIKTIVEESYRYTDSFRNLIDIFIAQSPDVIEVLRMNGVDSELCRFIPQYIGEEKLRKYPRPSGKPGVDRPIRLIYVGRWSREKGSYLLLRAFLEVDSDAKIELWIVSKNISQATIDQSINNNVQGSKSVKVFSNLDGAEVSKRIAQSDVCVIPSISLETGSRVVLEASAQQTPVIASSTVGNRYLIEDGVNGRIIPAGDFQALKTCVGEVVSQPEKLSFWSNHTPRPINRNEWLGMLSSVLEEAININRV